MNYFEDVKIKRGETLSGLASEYGYQSTDWRKIWQNPSNINLVKKRGEPRRIVEGDIIQIPIKWKVISKVIAANQPNRFGITVKRNGAKGKRIRWVQTVFQDNQAIGTTSKFCTDACPADDDDPFYWTSHELANDSTLRNTFSDTPSRNAPADRTTTWRAVLSLAIVTDKRVSVFESLVWGIDFGKNGVNKSVGPRRATEHEISGHLRLLRMGSGITQTFKTGGWTFRKAQNQIA